MSKQESIMKKKVLQLHKLEAAIEEYSNKVVKIKDELIDYMVEKELTEIVLSQKDLVEEMDESLVSEPLVAKLSERTTVTYDLPMIKTRIDPEIYKLIVDQDIVVTDFKAIARLMKKHQVPQKEFMQHVRKLESLNRAKLSNMYDIGEISVKDIKGCYTVSNKKYVKVSKITRA